MCKQNKWILHLKQFQLTVFWCWKWQVVVSVYILWNNFFYSELKKNCLTLAESFYYVRQLLIVNYYIKRQSNKLSEHWRFFVFKTKCELKCPNELFLNCHFSGNTSVSVFIIEIIWQNFDVIIDDPQLTIHNWCSRKTLLMGWNNFWWSLHVFMCFTDIAYWKFVAFCCGNDQ